MVCTYMHTRIRGTGNGAQVARWGEPRSNFAPQTWQSSRKSQNPPTISRLSNSPTNTRKNGYSKPLHAMADDCRRRRSSCFLTDI